MRDRLTGKRNEILVLLRLAGKKGKTNVELSKIALRYGGYLGKLYELGYVIDKENLGNGLFNYILISEPKEEVTEYTKAVDLLVQSVSNLGAVTAEQLQDLIENIGVSIRYKAGTHKESAKFASQMA